MLFGHSFVKRLFFHLRELAGPLHPGLFEQKCAELLKVQHHIKQVFLSGHSGDNTISPHVPHTVISKVKPSIIMIDLGSNDIAQGRGGGEIAQRLVDLAHRLRATYGALIIIMSVVPRDRGLGNMTPEQFRVCMGELEVRLRELVGTKGDQGIMLVKQSGFYKTQVVGGCIDKPVSEWSVDGIHPAPPHGMDRYMSSVREAIFRGIKVLRQ